MCLSTVYKEIDGKATVVMQDVSQLELKDEGVLLTGMFGEEKFVKGRIQHLDFLGGKTFLVDTDAPEAHR